MEKNLQQFFKCDPRALFQYLIAVALIGWLFVQAFSYATTPEKSYTATVTDVKSYSGEGGVHYLVVTDLADSGETHVFEFVVSPLKSLFDSLEDLSDSIEIGKSYIFNVYGHNRTKFLKEYETIASVKEVILQ